MKYTLSLVLLLLPVLLFSQVITGIEVRGADRVEPSFVVSSSGLLVGDKLSPESARRAIELLYATEVFSDVALWGEQDGEGVKVIIEVKENPVLDTVIIEGNKHISTNDLLKDLDIVSGEFLTPAKVFHIKKAIADAYREKGYLRMGMEVSKEEVFPGRVVLRVKVNEGDILRIKEIRVEGNECLTDKQVSRVMKNKPRLFIIRSGILKEEKFEEDKEKILKLYHKNGFPYAEVLGFKVEYDSTGRWIYLTVRLKEGKRFFTGDINIEGCELFPIDAVRKAIPLRRGKPFNVDKFNEGIQEIYGMYGDRGYLYLKVFPYFKERGDTMDVNIAIEEGEEVYVRRVDVKGNTKTWDKVIRRELTIFPGDVFSRERVMQSQRRLYNLGYFEDLGLDTKPVGDDSIDLIFVVKEKQTGQFQVGGSYSAVEGLAFNASISVPNLFGRGQQAYLRVSIGQQVQNYEGGFTEPWLFDTPTSVGGDLFYTTRLYSYYTETRKGGAFRLGRILPWMEDVKGYFSYRLEKIGIDISDTTLASEYLLSQEGERLRSTASLRFIRNTRNHYLTPTSGSYTILSTEFCGGWLGGEVHYQRYVWDTRWYHGIWKGLAVMHRFRFGYVAPYDTNEVPPYAKFIPGGVGDWGLRGYPDRSIGEKSGYYTVGGNIALVATVELRYYIAKKGFVLAFFDVGNAWSSVKEFRLDDLYRGAGVGFRVEIPMMGILGFDFGYGFDREGGGKWEPHFQLGASF